MSDSAPHGYEEDGTTPKAPFGYLRDGVTPRKGNRGARPGSGSRGRTRAPRARATTSVRNRSDKQRAEALVSLIDMTIVTPLAGLSMSPAIAKRFGPRHAMAFAGDSVILSAAAPGIAEGLVILSQSKPGVLAWMENVEEKAPYLMLATVGLQVVKALVENHLNPNEDLARAGGLQLQMKLSQMAQGIKEEAASMGIDVDMEPTVRIPEEAAA